MFKKLIAKIKAFVFKLYLIKKRKEIKNKNFSLFSNNCIAGFVYHELRLKFLSPTIDCLFPNIEDYLIFVTNLEDFKKNGEWHELTDYAWNCPLGLLQTEKFSIKIVFLHDNSFADATKKWNRRIQRINFDNIFIVLDSYNQDLSPYVNYFDKIEHLLIFCNENKIDGNVIYFNPGIYGEKYGYGKIFNMTNTIIPHRYLWNFNFVKWLNLF